MFERYTEQARQAIVLAQEEARLMQHSHIGTEHLLLGIARLEDDAAAQALRKLGLDLQRTRAEVVRHVPVGERTESGQIPFTAAATGALEVALREALGLGHDAVTPGHLLLGVLRQADGVARRILVEAGGDVHTVRETIVTAIGQAAPMRLPLVEPSPEEDAQLLLAILARGGHAAVLLRSRGIDEDAVRTLLGHP